MTPQGILTAFETAREPPIHEIVDAVAAKETMLPAFIAEFERALTVPVKDLPYRKSYGIMLEICCEWADSRAYLPITRMLALDGEQADDLLGDAITDTSERAIAAVATDDLTPVFDVIRNPRADEFARSALFGSLIRLAVARPALRASVLAFIESFQDHIIPGSAEYVQRCWAESIAVFGLKRVKAAALTAVAEAEGMAYYSEAEFEEALRNGLDDPSGGWWVREAARRDPSSAAEEVAKWQFLSDEEILQQKEDLMAEDAFLAAMEEKLKSGEDFSEQEIEEAYHSFMAKRAPSGLVPTQEELDDAYVAHFAATTPIVNYNRDVGRNDPCPCGSGKKYKKCCLDKAG